MKTLKPSSSYQLDLPEAICEQIDGRVSSFWLDGGPLLLQVSSYLRDRGRQLPAKNRLKERKATDRRKWTVWRSNVHPDTTVGQATAEFTDENGLLWVHSYLVWPHLTIYLIISGPPELVRDPENWAIQALKSVRLLTH